MLPTRPDIAVLVGQFQPLHNAHLELLNRALQVAPVCVVVIGSAHQARTPKNPFTWSERAEMIRLALPEAERARVRFLPVRDYYDQERWLHVVGEAIGKMTPGTSAKVALVGHFEDATSEYLRGFTGWSMLSVDRFPGIGGTRIRDAIFAGGPVLHEATLAALIDQAPPTTLGFLRAWAALPFLEPLHREWQVLRHYHEEWAAAPYPPVFVTVDAVVRCADHVLLIRRGQAPGAGLYAVPGGFIEQRETAYQSALRELAEETHLSLLGETMRRALRATAVFDHPDRSLRGRTITHAHCFDLGDRELPEVRPDDDAQSVAWVPISEIAALEDRFHDDHFHMLDHFLGLTNEGLSGV